MKKREIIEKIAKERLVEEIVKNLGSGENPDDMQDLGQMIYLDLLSKPDEKIEGMYERGEIRWYITVMVKNNIFSNNSPLYCLFKRNTNRHTELDTVEDLI